MPHLTLSVHSKREARSCRNRYRKINGSNPNFSKKHSRGIDYENVDEFPSEHSKVDSSQPLTNRTTNKSFNFEYLEFLKQKYKSTAPRRSRRRPKPLTTTGSAKRQFCSAADRVADRRTAAKIAAQQQQIMAKEDEINPTSLGGMMVIAIGAAIFYWLYHVDNLKHSGISSFLSALSRNRSLEDFIEAQETRPIHRIPDDWGALQVVADHVKNACLCLVDADRYNSEWLWSKLFRLFYIPSPKLLPPSKQTQYTLVIDLDTVCHSTWSRKEGFERTMRPFYREFLDRMFESRWEIVMFGQCEDFDWIESPDFAKLDGRGYIQNYLWNKDCYYFNGHRCKDLSRLGRDLKHVIAIDSDPRSVQMQPENGLLLKKWKPSKNPDSPQDTSLLQLIEFLEYLAKAEVADVRSVMAAYRGKDIAQEFRKQYFAAIQARYQQQYEEDEGREDGDDDAEGEEDDGLDRMVMAMEEEEDDEEVDSERSQVQMQ